MNTLQKLVAFNTAAAIGVLLLPFARGQTSLVRLDTALPTKRACEVSSAAALFTPPGQAPVEHFVAAWLDWRLSPQCLPQYTQRSHLGVAFSTNGLVSFVERFNTVKPTLNLANLPGNPQSTAEYDSMTAADPVTGDLFVGGIWEATTSSVSGVFVARKPASAGEFLDAVNVITDSANPSIDLHANVADKPLMTVGRTPESASERVVYIAYNQYDSNENVTAGIKILRSLDTGATWTFPANIPLASGWAYNGCVPRVGPAGELYVSMLQYSEILGDAIVVLRRSFDRGLTWPDSNPITIASLSDYWTPGGLDAHIRFPGTPQRAPLFPCIAVNPLTGYLYCVFFDTTRVLSTSPPSGLNDYDLDVYFTRSTNCAGGGPCTWTIPRRLFASGWSDQFFPWIECDSTGRLHLVFYDSRGMAQSDWDTVGRFHTSYAYSDNGGDTWTLSQITSSPWTLPYTSPCPIGWGDYIGMGVAGTTAYPVFTLMNSYESDPNNPSGDDTGDGDIYVKRIPR